LAAANVAARAALESRAFGDRLRVGSAGWRAIWLARPPHGEQLGLAYDTHDPELGWTLASGLRDVPLASAGSVSSNSRGVRGARFTPALALLVDAAVERLAWREDPAQRARVAGALLAEIVRETRAARATPVFVELFGAAGPGGSMQDVCAEQRIDCVFTAAD